MKVRIDDIVVKHRIRGEIGDISDLMESISKYGLLNPVSITESKELLAGYRRLEACRALGMDEIECRIIPVQSDIDRLLVEADENLTRKDLTVTEIGRFESQKRYLQARGFEKVRLWIIRVFRMLVEWIRKHIAGRQD
ncbi:MAG: ParB N-terminal domain-containing protein [Spirochaetes bacterium]|nr:ParB N-terminal domain-containing protein [Spirochaetota bacterium]